MTKKLSQRTRINSQPDDRPLAFAGLVFVLIALLMLGVTACQPESDGAEPAVEESSAEGAVAEGAVAEESAEQAETSTTELSEQDDSQAEEPVAVEPPPDPDALWAASNHASTFVMADDGTNSKCARCHAPVQWVPTMDDIPESCLTCKFEVEPPPPVIAEADWEHVPCQVCHKVKKDEVKPEYLWLEIAAIEEYAEVASTTELCMKCHEAVDVPGHEEPLFTEVHQDQTCTDCHDAHGTASGCSKSGCHEDAMSPAEPLAGHDEDHALVSCLACHDAAGLEVGLNEDTGMWTTFLAAGDAETPAPFASHQIQREAHCERCHFSGNLWGLSESVSPGS